MDWVLYGRGVTVCGFCGAMVAYEIVGKGVIVVGLKVSSETPLFCDGICRRAWETNLAAVREVS